MGPVLLIVNRNAGKRGVRREAGRAADRLREVGIDVDVATTGNAGEAARVIAASRDRVSCVVAVGGDGTLRGVVDAVGGSMPVGLIPRGTANVVARELGIPRDARRAADTLAAGRVRRIDLGRIEGRGTFLAMVGVGFDGRVVEGVGPGRMKAARMGLSAMRALISAGLPGLLVTIDGEAAAGPLYGVVAANTRTYGGWFAACPDASPDDGLLDTMLLRRGDRRALLLAGLAVVRRRAGSPAVVRYGRGTTIEIASANGVESPVQADGDSCGTTPVRLSIDPGAVAIIAPDPGGTR